MSYKELNDDFAQAMRHLIALLDIAPPSSIITRDAKEFVERINNEHSG